ncbi:MAG: lactate permease LctP family transporter [Rhodospirillaceae bacterium]|nr:lactate permease LctP family transporter [Rhodospirillaceae bacterium]
MNSWTQIYEPLGSVGVSTLVALIPIIFYAAALTVLNLKGHIAGTLTMLIAATIAILVYGMPWTMTLAAALQGFAFGLWPIAWIITGAVFLYRMTVKTGQFDIIRDSIVSITSDQRLQLLLIGFSFGAFLEGAAGFGAPVAITTALLAGLGFNPLYAAGLCLIANTAPVAFGGMGISVLVGGAVGGVDPFLVGAQSGRVLAPMILLVPFWLVFIMDGWRGVKETWPAVLVAASSFTLGVVLTSNLIGFELPAILGSLSSLVSMTLFLKFWQPKRIFRFDGQQPAKDSHHHSPGKIFWAWLPFIILTLVMILWNMPFFKALFAEGGALAWSTIRFSMPYLDGLAVRTPPITPTPTPYPAIYSLNLIQGTGTAIMTAAILAMILQRTGPKLGATTFIEVTLDLKKPVWTIGMVVALAYICNYSGLTSTLALAMAHTGPAATFFSPILGALGVFLTGSDTASNALFCGLQAVTAQQVGVSDILLVAANNTGGTAGKMISPQSIAIAAAAAGLVGREGSLFRFTLKHSFLCMVVIGALTTIQAYLLPGTIPS